jgi:hypothetical protein
MDALNPKTTGKSGPEHKIQEKIIKKLRYLEWFVKVMHGNKFQLGFPDLFACHKRYGIRLIEVKLPDMKGSRFQASQIETFPLLVAHGAGVWILTGDSDSEYNKLFKKSNWHHYLLKTNGTANY